MNTSLSQVNPVVRAVLVIGSIAALVSGITFAALSSTATLSANTIASATADLQVDNTDSATSGFGASDTGFTFTGVVPGGAGSNLGNFSLKNNGTATLGLKVSVPVAPTFTDSASAPVTVDNSKVKVVFKKGAGAEQTFTLTQLLAVGGQPLADNLAAATTDAYTVKVTFDADAFSGTGVTSSAFNFVFDGTAL